MAKETAIVLKTMKTDDHDSLCVPSDRLSLDGEKDADDHNLSPRAIRLDCLWIAKRVQMTIICLCMPSDLHVSG